MKAQNLYEFNQIQYKLLQIIIYPFQRQIQGANLVMALPSSLSIDFPLQRRNKREIPREKLNCPPLAEYLETPYDVPPLAECLHSH